MANFRTGVLVTGDATGAVKSLKLTEDQIKALNAAQKKNATFTQTLAKQYRSSMNIVRNFGLAVASAATVLGTFVQKGRTYADELAKTADTLDLTTEKLAGLRVAAGIAGLDVEKFTKSVQKMGENIGDALRGTGLAVDALEELGIVAQDIVTLPLDQQLGRIADAMQNVTNVNQRLNIAADLFGARSGRFMLKLLQEGSAELDKWAGAAATAGIAIDRDFAAQIEASNDAIFRIQNAVQGFGVQLSGQLAPILERTADRLFEFIERAGGMQRIVGRLVDSIEYISAALKTFGVFILARTVIPAVGALVTTFNAAAASAGVFARSMAVASRASAVFGGLPGLAITAAAALFTFSSAAAEVQSATMAANESVDQMLERFGQLSARDQQLELLGQKASFEELQVTLADLAVQIQDTSAALENPLQSSEKGLLTRRLERLQSDFEETSEAADAAAIKIAAAEIQINESRKSFDLAANAELVSRAQQQYEIWADRLVATASAAEQAQREIAKIDENLAEFKGTDIFPELAKQAEELKKRIIEGTKGTDEFADALDEARKIIDSSRTPTQRLEDQLESLRETLASAVDPANVQVLEQAIIITEEQIAELAKETCKSAEQIEECLTEAERESREAWENFGTELKDIFADAFLTGGDFLDNFVDRAKEAAKELLARNVFGGLVDVFVGGLSAGASGAGGGASGGFISSLFGGAASSFAGGSGGDASLFNSALSYFVTGGASGGLGSLGTGAAATGASGTLLGEVGGSLLSSAAYGFVGAYAGNRAGEALFSDKEAESNTGASVGAAIGTAVAPGIGTLIGAALGAIVDVATGGDGKKDLNLGAQINFNEPDSSRRGETFTGASGLTFQGYSRRTQEYFDTANQFAETLSIIDTALTQAANSAGIAVDFSNVSGDLFGRSGSAKRSNVAGPFLGLNGYNQLNIGGSLDEQAAVFVQQWINALSDELSVGVRRMLSGIETGASADQIAAAFEGALRFEQLIDLDVVGDIDAALDALGDSQKTIAEQYREATVSVMDLSAAYDNSTESIAGLSQALGVQKSLAAELALQYRVAAAEADALFGGTIQTIRESLLSEEELYNSRRAAIQDLTNELSGTTDAEEISALVNSINTLAGTAFGSLDESQQQTLGQEFITFLDEANALAQQQIDAGQANLAATESSVQETLKADTQFADSTDAFSTAVDQFGALVGNLNNVLSGGIRITVDTQNGEQTFVIPADIGSEVNF